LRRTLPARAWHVLFTGARGLNTRRGKRPAVPAQLRLRLLGELEGEIQRLELLLGRELPFWRSPRS
jgi:hypothetical protein